MPTIQQLVRSRRIQIKRKQSALLWLIVLNDVVYVLVFNEHQKNQILQFVK